MRDELYIDNQRVDLSADTGIYLDYKSYILDDISKLNASHSYTIKAPRTAHNCRLIKGADIIGSTSDFPKVTHSVRLLRDGIEIISDADLYLLSVTKSELEFTIVWNKYGQLSKAKNDNLNDLQSNTYTTYQGYALTTWDKTQDRRFPYIDIGMMDEPSFFQPVLYLDEIFGIIESNYGVTFDIPQNIKSEMADYCLPLLTRNGHEKTLNVDGYTNKRWMLDDREIVIPLVFSGVEQNDIIEDYDSASFINLAPDTTYHFRATGTIEFRADRDYPETYVPNFLYLTAYHKKRIPIVNEGWFPDAIVGYSEIAFAGEGWHEDDGETSSYYYYRYNVDVDIEIKDIEANGLLRAEYQLPYREGNWSSWGLDYGVANLKHWIEVERKVLPYYSNRESQLKAHKYYLADNLPKIKILDFVKSVAWAFGLFCYESDGVIKFRSFSELSNNKSIGKDWSDYLISIGDMSYTLPSVAKNNKFEYANDNDVLSSGKVITIDNETLEDEAAIVSSKLNAVKNVGYLASAKFELCEKKDDFDPAVDWDKWTYNEDSKAYLLKTIGSYGDRYKAVFASNWSDVLDRYWQTYIRMMEDTRLLTCTMQLNPIVLKTIDFAVPVYLKQLGAYFAIQNIKTKQNDIAEVKLIRL